MSESLLHNLQSIWGNLNDHGPLGVLARSARMREKSENLSEKCNVVLDTYWNKLEDNAKIKVDRQLVEMGFCEATTPEKEVSETRTLIA